MVCDALEGRVAAMFNAGMLLLQYQHFAPAMNEDMSVQDSTGTSVQLKVSHGNSYAGHAAMYPSKSAATTVHFPL